MDTGVDGAMGAADLLDLYPLIGAGGWAGRSAQAAAAGLAAAMGVPIMAGGRVVAVAAFFATTPRPYDADAVAAVHGIAGVLGNELTDAGLPP